jgi:hypothetical protein
VVQAAAMQVSMRFHPKDAEYDRRLAEIDAKLPPAGQANIKDF